MTRVTDYSFMCWTEQRCFLPQTYKTNLLKTLAITAKLGTFQPVSAVYRILFILLVQGIQWESVYGQQWVIKSSQPNNPHESH